ncbi:MAG: ComEC/Rec2 family competence protein, partial [Hyphomicrobiaceae bacterium]
MAMAGRGAVLGAVIRLLSLPSAAAIRKSVEAEQDRWFLWLPVLVGAGIALYFALPIEPHWTAAAAVLLAAAGMVLVAGRDSLARLTSLAMLALAVGFATAQMRALLVAAPVLDRDFPNAIVSGFVELIEPQGTRGQRLTIRTLAVGGVPPRSVPYRIRVRARTPDRSLRVGDAVELRGRLGPPPPPALPGDYDFARRAWFLGIGGVGFVHGRIVRMSDPPRLPVDIWLRSYIEKARAELNASIAEALPGSRGQIATALITGDQGGIAPQDLKALRESGLAHILSVSGLHMAIMAGALFWGMRLALAAIPAVALRYPVKKWAAVGGIAGAYVYFLTSGAAVATERSFIMITLMLAAVILDRRALSLRNVALAGFLILLYKPESLLDVSFQMSFSAVVALIAVYEAANPFDWAKGRPGRLAIVFVGGIGLTTLVAGFASAPFAAYHFNRFVDYGLLANLLAAPLSNFWIMPCAVLAMFLMPLGLEALGLVPMGWGIAVMNAIAHFVAGLPGAVQLV